MLILIECTVSLQYNIDETVLPPQEIKGRADREMNAMRAELRQRAMEDTQSTFVCKE